MASEKSEALPSVSKPKSETDEEDYTFDLPNRDDVLELEVGPTEVNYVELTLANLVSAHKCKNIFRC